MKYEIKQVLGTKSKKDRYARDRVALSESENNSEQENYRSAALFTYSTLPDHQTTLAITLVQCGLNYLPVFY